MLGLGLTKNIEYIESLNSTFKNMIRELTSRMASNKSLYGYQEDSNIHMANPELVAGNTEDRVPPPGRRPRSTKKSG